MMERRKKLNTEIISASDFVWCAFYIALRHKFQGKGEETHGNKSNEAIRDQAC